MNQMMTLTDHAIAVDLLQSAKAGVRSCALAITEAATPQVRQALNEQLQQSIAFHERITNYMVDKGYYYPYNMEQQLQLDQQAAQQVLQQQQQTQP